MKTSLIQKTALVFFGIFLSLLILEASMRFCGFLIVSAQNYQNAVAMKQKHVIRILCLGESTTQAGPEPYPEQLEQILNRWGKGIKFSVLNKGLSGITTSYIAEHLEENLASFQPDIVITMMGVNDSGAHMPYEYSLPGRRPFFLEKSQVYKLIRYLWLHMKAKVREWKTYFEYSKNNKTSERDPSFEEVAVNRTDSFDHKETLPDCAPKEPLREGHDHIDNGRGQEAEQVFKAVIARSPGNYEAYIGLAMAYDRQERYAEAEKTYQEAIIRQPNRTRAYLELGSLYHRTGREKEAEQYFQKAVQIEPDDSEANFQLGWSYKLQGMEAQAKEQLRKAAELIRLGESIPIDSEAWGKMDWVWGRQASLYRDAGDEALVDEYYRKANAYRNEHYNPVTRGNYLRIKKILDSKDVQLVCVQYPVRNVEPLKKIFKGHAGVVFVDNEKVFKDALKQGGYKEYFTDIFAGDFGHCTAKGNRLLAENIAKTILKELFHQ